MQEIFSCVGLHAGATLLADNMAAVTASGVQITEMRICTLGMEHRDATYILVRDRRQIKRWRVFSSRGGAGL